MNRREIELLYKLRGEEAWPSSPLKQYYRVFCEHITFDTSFYHWNYVVSGGDPVTRSFALRALSRIAKGTVLVVDPIHENEAHTPWIFDSAVHEELSEKFGIRGESFFGSLEQMTRQSLRVMETRCRVYHTSLAPVFYLGEDARVCVLRPRARGVCDPYQAVHRSYERVFEECETVSVRPALIGGRLDALWYLSGRGCEKWQGIEDFSFPVSANTPMLKAQSIWIERLEHLWRLSSVKG